MPARAIVGKVAQVFASRGPFTSDPTMMPSGMVASSPSTNTQSRVSQLLTCREASPSTSSRLGTRMRTSRGSVPTDRPNTRVRGAAHRLEGEQAAEQARHHDGGQRQIGPLDRRVALEEQDRQQYGRQ